MKYRLAILICCFEVIVATHVFAQANPPAQKPLKPAEETPPVLAVPTGYRYEAHGRRDPFVNPIPPPPVAPPPPPGPPPPPPRPLGMKGVDVDAVSILGVFVSKVDPAMTRAILQVPGLKAPVLASRGDVLFDGVIKEIRADSVVFTMMTPGNKPRNPADERDVVKKLRGTAGDKK